MSELDGAAADPFAPPPWAVPPTSTGWSGGFGARAARPSRARGWWRREVLVALGVAAVTLLLGAPAGLLWSAVSPRAALVKTADGVDLRSPETKAFVGADGSFALTVLMIGVVAGAVAVLLARRRRAGAVLGAVAGGLAASAVAAAVGHRVGYADFVALRDHAAAGARGSAYLSVRSTGALLVWPAAAALGALLAGLVDLPRAARAHASGWGTSGQEWPGPDRPAQQSPS